MSFIQSTGRFLVRGLTLGYYGRKTTLHGGQAKFSLAGVSKSDFLRFPEINGTQMIALSAKVHIMKGEVSVALFKQVMVGYEITGDNADKLKTILANPSRAGENLTYVSLLDAREFAKRLSDLTGRKFRAQTEGEWLQAKDRLSGNDHSTWTETKYDPDTCVMRALSVPSWIAGYPRLRNDFNAIRLVEDM